MKACNEKCEVYSRVVGFYSPVHQWNKGKQEEFEIRKTFKLQTEEEAKEEKDENKSIFTSK